MNTRRTIVPVLLISTLTASAAAQAIWLPVTTVHQPTPRMAAAMAHDYLRDRVVMFGGWDPSYNFLGDTWEFDGTDWTQRFPSASPPAGIGGMSYDRGRGVVVFVQGSAAQPTWEYDGVTWTHRTFVVNPPVSEQDLLVYDSNRGVHVLFVQGGNPGGGQTWEYSGYAWTQRFPAASPPQRYAGGMAYDPLRGRTILHGGSATPAPWVTWEYDGTNWAVASPWGSNPAFAAAAFAFDPYRRRAVSFSGYGSTQPNTYEYDTAGWQLRTNVGPTARYYAAMVYDLLRQECVMFGGQDNNTFAVYGDTYRYRSLTPAAVVPYGQGCAGSAIVPGFAPQPYHAPYVGMTFGLRMYSAPIDELSFVAFGTSNTTTGSAALPLSLQFLGMPNCSLYTSADLLLPNAVSGANGTTSFAIPPQPALAGVHFYVQGFAFAPGANPAGLIDTRALACTIGVP